MANYERLREEPAAPNESRDGGAGEERNRGELPRGERLREPPTEPRGDRLREPPEAQPRASARPEVLVPRSSARNVDIPPLVTLGHPRLAQPSAPVALSDVRSAEFQRRLRTLHDAMAAHRGIGIAAPQVGWFERFFLMGIVHEREGQEPELELQAWIDPEIVERSSEQGWAWEGCLSVPGLRGWIRRPMAVAVAGYNADGARVSREFNGWPARVFQHEFDHLDGMLIPYRLQNPRHLVTLEQLAQRETWPDDWPAKGAAQAPFGQVIPEADG